MAQVGKTTFSNSHAASADSFAMGDSQVDQSQTFYLLSQDPASAVLYSIGNNPSATTIVGHVSVPTELMTHGGVGYQTTTTLGAKVTILDGSHVSYDASGIHAAVDALAVGQQVTDSFLYAIQMADGTVSWNSVSIALTGAAARITVSDNGVHEDAHVDSSGNLTDTVDVSALASSGYATGFSITGAATNLGGISPATGSGSAGLTYAVSNAAVYETGLGFGEMTKDSFTVTTTNQTTQTFTETIAGSIHAPSVSASAAQASLEEGQSTRVSIAASDHDDNAVLSYAITGVPADATLSSAADPSGVQFDAHTGTYSVAAGALGDLTFTAGAEGQVTFGVTVTNTESAGAATATAATTQDIAIAVHEIAQAPNLSVQSQTLSVDQGGAVALNIVASPAEADQQAPTVTITGLGDATLTNTRGDTVTVNNGSITLTASQLAGLTLHAGAASTSNYDLSITATDAEFDTAASSASSITVSVHATAPAVQTFTIGVAGKAESVYQASNADGDVVGTYGNYAAGFEYHHDTGTFSVLDHGDSTAWVVPNAINGSGVVVGDYANAATGYNYIPFTYDGSSYVDYGNGYFSLTAVSSDGVGAGTTQLDPWIGSPDGNPYPFFDTNGVITYVNHSGTAAAVGAHGDWLTGYSNNGANNYQGWVFTSSHTTNWVFENGSLTNINAPGAAAGQTYSVNFDAAGDVSGTYRDTAGVARGFVYSNGAYHEFNAPNGGTFDSDGGGLSGVTAVGEGGFAAGVYNGTDGHQHGLVYDPRTHAVTSFDAPNHGNIRESDYSYWGSTHGTMAISADGKEVAGMYTDSTGEHGFIFKDGVVSTLDAPGYAILTPHAIDSHGDIIGNVSLGGPYDYGLGQVFVARPTIDTFGAVTAAPQSITGFHPGLDTIDLSAITSLSSVAVGSSSQAIDAGQVLIVNGTGGNADVYVNASGSAEAVGSADMHIQLVGVTTGHADGILSVADVKLHA